MAENPYKCLRVALIVLALLATAAASAHDLSAPAQVIADPDGHFAYEITIIIDPSVEFAFSEMDGSDNTDIGHLIADGFCMVVVEAGEYIWPVNGNLLEVDMQGSVIYTHAMCDGWQETVTTIVLPYVVATETQTWTTIKEFYR